MHGQLPQQYGHSPVAHAVQYPEKTIVTIMIICSRTKATHLITNQLPLPRHRQHALRKCQSTLQRKASQPGVSVA